MSTKMAKRRTTATLSLSSPHSEQLASTYLAQKRNIIININARIQARVQVLIKHNTSCHDHATQVTRSTYIPIARHLSIIPWGRHETLTLNRIVTLSPRLHNVACVNDIVPDGVLDGKRSH